MTIRVANSDFDRVDYDADGNVLYLAAGDPERVVGFEETQEGDAVRYAHCDELVGITVVNARRLRDENGGIRITLPEAISAAVLRPALIGAEERSSGWLRWVTSGQWRVPNDAVRCRSLPSRQTDATQAFGLLCDASRLSRTAMVRNGSLEASRRATSFDRPPRRHTSDTLSMSTRV